MSLNKHWSLFSQTLFLFTGLQNYYFDGTSKRQLTDATTIVQPVLQWGSSYVGGGSK